MARVERFFIILGLSFVLSTPNPVTAQLSLVSATREAQMALTWVAMAAGVLLLAAGARSRWLKRWRWSLQRRDWFLWSSPRWYS